MLKVQAGAGCTLHYELSLATPLTGPDPWGTAQWHLSNGGQSGGTAGEDIRAWAAWSAVPSGRSRGQGVRVAVVDDAVELTHPDLWPNQAPQQSYSYRAGQRASMWPVPCERFDDHGTAVAGLVAARDDNQQGGMGVAPRASLVAYDALASGFELDIVDALLRDQGLNQIYQNSWGSLDDGALHPASSAFVAALDTGLAAGRGGLGSVLVFSGGNGGCDRTTQPGCLLDNVNYDGYVNQRAIIAVCAVDHDGRGPRYSEPGAVLLVCAPSSGTQAHLTTTGLEGSMRSDFGGTSGAAPQVSGVVALMLAANPALTWRDVRWILAGTARKNDPSHPGWRSAFGYHFNHQYGFGVVDAAAAVAAAANWVSVGGSATQQRCGPYARTPALNVPDRAAGGAAVMVTDTVSISDCPITQLEWVEIELTTTHATAGDLQVRLISPNGVVSQLADWRTCPNGCGRYDGWRLGSMAHLAEPVQGAWQLELADWVAGGAGTLASWRVTFYGR